MNKSGGLKLIVVFVMILLFLYFSNYRPDIKKDDIVLVDYTATQTGPRMVIVKLLRGEVGKRAWKQYKDHFERMRTKGPAAKAVTKQSYVG